MVIKQLQHWFVARANAARWKPLADWAESLGGQLRVVNEGQGFILDMPPGRAGGAVRIEWGPSQRAYIPGHELRIRYEARLHADLQMMVIEQQLMEQLEGAVFEAYTDTLRTRVDTDTPEEMRWLVMFPKLTQISSKIVRNQFGVLGIARELLHVWIEGRFSEALARVSQDLVTPGRPFVLMSMRGNLYLRMAMEEPRLSDVQSLYKLCEIAVDAAERVSQALGDSSPWPSVPASTTMHGTLPGPDSTQ